MPATGATGGPAYTRRSRLLVEGELQIAGGLIGLGGELPWPRPTYPGDTLRVESEILEIRASESKPDRGVATRTRTTRAGGSARFRVVAGNALDPAND